MTHLTRVIRFVRHWHARLGVLLAIFFLILAVTGLALNHTDALGLAKREINAAWLMRWYGLESAVPKAYLFKDGYLAAFDERWVMDGQRLAGAKPVPVGAISWSDLRAVAERDNLYLFMPDGQVLDKLSGAALPGKTIEQLGRMGSELALKTEQGIFTTSDGLSWQPVIANDKRMAEVRWSVKTNLPSATAAGLNEILAPSLPLERIILDLHSGRIFGHYGWIVMDIAALGLVLLSLSGVWIYLRSIRKRKNH
ncbi:MAG: hypothetical protein HOP04_14790 [Methylophilaceae bacterium]|nr:hypothetical protein [Methylophilaceae bacterium]